MLDYFLCHREPNDGLEGSSIKRNKNVEMLLIGLLVLQTVAAIAFYSILPAQIPTHWDMDGQVNGWMSRLWGTLVPLFISFGVYLLFLLIPLLDPKKKIRADQKGYTAFRVGTQVLTFALFFIAGGYLET